MSKKNFTNQEVAEILREMSICYAMDDTAFKPAAYSRAADAISNLGENALDILKRGGVKELKKTGGIGQGIAEHIEKLGECGTFDELSKCRQRMPQDVLELVAVPNLGPKRVQRLYQELHVRTLNDLRRAAEQNKILELDGFGEKTQQNILDGIKLLRSSEKRRLLGEVLPLARDIEQGVKKLPSVQRAMMAGSVRRRQETVGDFDLVVTSSSPPKNHG